MSGLEGAVTVALYIIQAAWHRPLRGHIVFLLQLQVSVGASSVGVRASILVLWEAMIAPIDFIQLYETFTVELFHRLLLIYFDITIQNGNIYNNRRIK